MLANNNVNLIGRVDGDPSERIVDDVRILDVVLAVASEAGSASGSQIFTAVLAGKRAKLLGPQIYAGRLIAVGGELTTEPWVVNGRVVSRVVVRVRDVTLTNDGARFPAQTAAR